MPQLPATVAYRTKNRAAKEAPHQAQTDAIDGPEAGPSGDGVCGGETRCHYPPKQASEGDDPHPVAVMPCTPIHLTLEPQPPACGCQRVRVSRHFRGRAGSARTTSRPSGRSS